MTPFYEDPSITLFLGDSSEFIRTQLLSLAPDVVITDPPNDRSTDLDLWRAIREVTGSLHLTANTGVLDDWFHTLRAAGFDFKRATPWPRAESRHGDYWDALLSYGEDPGAIEIIGDVDYSPETEFPGERNVEDWRRYLSGLTGESFFDPFPGSGSLMVAAADCSRFATGVEVDRRWAEIAVARFEARAQR